MSLPEVIYFPMVCLNCEDLKHSLANCANSFAKMLMEKIFTDFRKENER